MDFIDLDVLAVDQVAERTLSVASGNLIVFPVDSSGFDMLQITLTQLSQTQDYSLRFWVSVYPNGMPLIPGYVSILKAGGLPLVLFASGLIPPTDSLLCPIAIRQQYMVNVLNLTNEPNVLGVTTTRLA